jgi:hypothetical protein
MEMIRRRERVKDNRITIRMPEGFREKEVDVIIIPIRKKARHFESLDRIALKTGGFRFDREDMHRR